MISLAQILAQQSAARKELATVRKAFPAAFDRNGRAIVATLRFPGKPASAKGGEDAAEL